MLSRHIADFTVGLSYEDLPASVVEESRTAVTDWLGSVAAGSREPPAEMLAAVVRRAGGNHQATLVGFNEKSSALNAALVNGTSCHILELDDLHRSSILHPAAPIISAAAAAAEERGASGCELIAAVVTGFEVGIRIAEAVTPSHYYYWHTTATCGTFGAAIAAAKIYSLTADQIIDALGNAGSQAAGLWEFLQDGAMTKHLHPGKAAMNGLLAAQLAEQGFTGAGRILEGEKGFFKAMAKEYEPAKVTAGLGSEYRILGNSYKIYPSCRHTHSGVDLALKLAEEGLEFSEIEKIVVKTYSHARDLVGEFKYDTPYKAKFSLPFCVAAAMVEGRLNLKSFDFSSPVDPRTVELAQRCRVVADPELEVIYPACWAAVIEVTLKDGQFITARTDYPRGDPENPATKEEMLDKFKTLALFTWPEERVNSALAHLNNLEHLDRVGILFD